MAKKKTFTQLNVWEETKEILESDAAFRGQGNFTQYMHQLAKSRLSTMQELKDKCTCGAGDYYGPTHDKSCEMCIPF